MPGSGDGEQKEGLQIKEEGLQYIAQLKSPLFFVSVLGVYRGGKSLLLNRLRGLSTPYLGGFGVGHGQDTFTRGISVCAEEVSGVGTIVWMDTEGLWSAEEARSAYGPKIFSLALLFSSSVLLNSVKVLNEQFFAFFGEQQQIARVLKKGLEKEGLPPAALLPSNLSIFWVLQQPINYNSKSTVSKTQLDSFLDMRADETRAGMRRDFKHAMHEVPVASYDVQTWGRLETLPDDELVPDYVSSAGQLREKVLYDLRSARPMHAASAAKQLEMYVQLVQTEQFSGALAMEAFEQNEIGTLCSSFRQKASDLAGQFPSTKLPEAFAEANSSLEERRSAVISEFHFGGDWSKKMDGCVKEQITELERQNAEVVLTQWQKVAGQVAEDGSCFFLGQLAAQLSEYGTIYGSAFGADVQARALEYASALQRARLVECVRLRDFLWPLMPWLLWPIGGFYLGKGALSGLMTMGIHAVGLCGIYVLLQLFGRLPVYLDVDYPMLRKHPILLTIVMNAPPSVPWNSIGRLWCLCGCFFSAYKMVRFMLFHRPAGAAHIVPGLNLMELKLNIILKRQEATFKHDLSASAISVVDCLDRGNARAAAMALVQGLSLVREIDSQDHQLSAFADAQFQRRVRGLLQNCKLPPVGKPVPKDSANRLVEAVAQGEFEKVLEEMFSLLHILSSSTAAASPAASPLAASPVAPRSLEQSLDSVAAADVSISPIGGSPAPSPAVGSPNAESLLAESAEDDEDFHVGDEEEAGSGAGGSKSLMFVGAVAVCVTAYVVTHILPDDLGIGAAAS